MTTLTAGRSYDVMLVFIMCASVHQELDWDKQQFISFWAPKQSSHSDDFVAIYFGWIQTSDYS